MSIISGTVVRLYTKIPFTSITGTVVDPDVVQLEYSVQGQSEVMFTYTAGNLPPDPSLTIVRDGVGTYHADIDTTNLPGTWSWGWNGYPNSGIDFSHTQVVWEGEFIVSPEAL